MVRAYCPLIRKNVFFSDREPPPPLCSLVNATVGSFGRKKLSYRFKIEYTYKSTMGYSACYQYFCEAVISDKIYSQ